MPLTDTSNKQIANLAQSKAALVQARAHTLLYCPGKLGTRASHYEGTNIDAPDQNC